MTEKKQKEDYEEPEPLESVLHHVHHGQKRDFSREVSINGSVHSVTIQSCDPAENLEYLGKKALELLYKAKEGGKPPYEG